MLRSSFRFASDASLPLLGPRKLATASIAAALAVALAGCGGGHHEAPRRAVHRVAGAGYSVAVPTSWRVERARRRLSARPRGDAVALVGVSTYRLLKPYRAALFGRTVRELDRVAARFAGALGGRVVASRTVRVAGERVRQYDVEYGPPGRRLVQRTTFVLRGRSEYQLTCRYRAGERRPLGGRCARFTASFRLAAPPA